MTVCAGTAYRRLFQEKKKMCLNVYYQRIGYLRTGTFFEVSIKNFSECISVRIAIENLFSEKAKKGPQLFVELGTENFLKIRCLKKFSVPNV